MNRLELRKKYGYSKNDFIITVVAELNRNKNQMMLLEQAENLLHKIPAMKILLIGKETLPDARNFVEEKHLENCVEFLGYRNDIPDLTKISDLAFSASKREGLPANIIEALACGIPVVASMNRGHCSLIQNGKNGLLFPLDDSKIMCGCILSVYESMELRELLSKNAVESAKKYDLKSIRLKMAKIYDEMNESGNTSIVSEWGGVTVFDFVNSAASSFGRRAA